MRKAKRVVHRRLDLIKLPAGILDVVQMKVDDGLKEQEFNAIINTLHHQVININRVVHAK